MRENVEEYIVEKEARRKRLTVYAEKIQERVLHSSSDKGEIRGSDRGTRK